MEISNGHRLGSVPEKIAFIRQLLIQNKSNRATDIYGAVRKQFGSGIDGTTVKILIKEVRPNYVGKTFKKKRDYGIVDGTVKGLDSNKKIKIAKLFKSFGKLGISHNLISKAIKDAEGEKPIVFLTIDSSMKMEIEKRFERDGIVCLRATRKGKVVFVAPNKIKLLIYRKENN